MILQIIDYLLIKREVIMSNYIFKDNYSFLSSRTGNGDRILGFQDTVTPPENIAVLFRDYLSVISNDIKRRPFNVFSILNRNSSAKADLNGPMVQDYIEIIRAIFKPFILSTGKFNSSVSYSSVLNEIRMKIARHLIRITDCSDVNVVFKTPTGSSVDEEITFFINDSSILDNKPMSVKFDNTGLKLSKTTSSITVVVPIRYIQNIITKTFYKVSSDFKKENVKTDDYQGKLLTLIMVEIETTQSKKFFKALCASVYKEFIFNSFARDVMFSSTQYLYNKEAVDIAKETIPMTNDSDRTISVSSLADSIIKHGILQINPHIILDLFEIGDVEMNTFINNFVRDENNLYITTPEYANLHLPRQLYADEESAVSSSITFVTKLNYCILFLMMNTKSSIKEATRSQYCSMLHSGINSAKSISRISYITRSKQELFKELETQIARMEVLSINLIKLRSIIEAKYGVIAKLEE